MISNSDGQTHCNCKKSKCLKLYCDCFASGFYCDESCSCQECFNRLDYEDTVEETRQQIKLRNPCAFSPKIHCLTQSPSTQIVEDGDQVTQIAGKHKKGCNCKKSMCSKKYCECYQAKVGCSGECRCEGCKNVYGIKEGYNAYNESTPWTSFQHASQFNGCYIPSPQSPNREMMLGTCNENYDIAVPLDQQVDQNVNQFTHHAQFSSRHPTSVNSLQWPGSVISAIPLTFGGPIVDEFNDKPAEIIHGNSMNTPSDSYIHPTQGEVTRWHMD